jgi:hypothetical protein
MERVDRQTLDATHRDFAPFWSVHFAPLFGKTPRLKATKRQGREAGHSSARGRIEQPAAQTVRHNRVLPPLDFSAIDVANTSDTPASATESMWSSQTQTSATPSDDNPPHFFPLVPYQRPSAPHMNEVDSDLQWDFIPPSAFLYPHLRTTSTSMFSSRQTGNSGGMMYPGKPHCMDGMVPFHAQPTSRPLPHPHQPLCPDGTPQAGASHTIPTDFLPRQSFISEGIPRAGAYTNPDYSFPSKTQAVPTHLMQLHQPPHQPTVWQTAAESSQSKTYPHPPYHPPT